MFNSCEAQVKNSVTRVNVWPHEAWRGKPFDAEQLHSLHKPGDAEEWLLWQTFNLHQPSDAEQVRSWQTYQSAPHNH